MNAGLIVGRVIDAATAEPVSRVEVILQSALHDPRTGQPKFQWMPRILTSSDGYFVFREVPAGKFEIVATRRGYTDGRYGRRRPNGPSQQLTLGNADRVGDIVIKLWQHAAISGIVTDEAGEALVAVHLRALRKSVVGGQTRVVPAAFAITDDRGAYRLSGLTPGEYVVVSSSRQVAVPLSTAQQANTGVDSLIRTMGGSNSLPGTATAIQTSDAVFPLGGGTPIPSQRADGRLFIYPATFHPSGGLSQAMPIAVSAGEERAGIDLRLQPAVTVRVAGSLVATESVLATVPVLLRPAGSDDPSLEADWPAAISDADGRFTFPAVPAGDYTLRAATSRQPLYWGESPIVVGREDIDGIALNLQPGFRISGRVIFEGHTPAPPPSALKELSIVVEPAAGTWALSERTSTIRVDTTGQFTTAGLPRGRYFLRLSDSPVGWMFKSAMHGGRDLSDVAVELLAGDVTGVGLTFTDRWTSFSGLVLPSQGVPTGMAIDATVLLFPVDPQFWNDPASNPRRIRSTGTGKNGEFTFASVPPGEYYAVAVTDESANDWQDAGFMQTLTRFATRVTIDEGEHKKLDLRMRDAR